MIERYIVPAGKTTVTDTETNEVVSEHPTMVQAQHEADRLNQEMWAAPWRELAV